MKKIWICTILCIGIVLGLAVAALAAPAAPKITLQPQTTYYPEYSVASYTVKASGTNLTATWYLEWEGKQYNLSDNTNGMEPWEGYAGENYGGHQDGNSFTWFFSGIEAELNGGYIWCVIEDGHYDVKSQKAMICVGDYATNPTILEIPNEITVNQGQEAQIRCVAKSNDGSQLSFLWYETATGNLQDIQAVNRGTEDSDFMFCDTSTPGTRNYICMVRTTNGGMAYSSAVTVTVNAKQSAPAPTIQTKSLPDGTVGQPYSAQIKCSDPNAEIYEYYNPGKANDFGKTGLKLTKDGKITGTPKTAGSFTFCVCAAGQGGEEYQVYTLTVKEVPPSTQPQTTVPVMATEPTETIPESMPEETTEPTAAPTEEITPMDDGGDEGISPLLIVLIALSAAGASAFVTILILKKKS